VNVASDRLGVPLDQLDSARAVSRRRLDGLSDEEYRWEPVPGCWSIRRCSETVGADAFGPGDWQLDVEVTGFSQYPWSLDPGYPFIGIAWWTNQETIHYLAEIALLRDLWRAENDRAEPGAG
jgi:hypothetical protein